MDILIPLAGAVGLVTSLIQQKPLPTEAEALRALDKLVKNPDDPDANTVAGKYASFVLGDYQEGLPLLAKSNDKNLKTLADHELDPTHVATALQKVEMGDEWVLAIKKFPALWRIFFDRAGHWYKEAWPNLDAAAKVKLRQQGAKLSEARPFGGARKGMPSGWVVTTGVGGRPSVLDGTIARIGSYSGKLLPADEKVQGSGSTLTSEHVPVQPSKPVEFVAFTRSDGTENGADTVSLGFWDANNNAIAFHSALVPVDVPFWTPLKIKVNAPANAARVNVQFWMFSKKGNYWIDDVSLKIDGRQVFRNGSFEER